MNTLTQQLKKTYDYLAPDGSEIYLLLQGAKGGLCRCELPPGNTSQAVFHKTVEELWYFIEGHGEVYRKSPNTQAVMQN